MGNFVRFKRIRKILAGNSGFMIAFIAFSLVYLLSLQYTRHNNH